jgi:hypothetical protein
MGKDEDIDVTISENSFKVEYMGNDMVIDLSEFPKFYEKMMKARDTFIEKLKAQMKMLGVEWDENKNPLPTPTQESKPNDNPDEDKPKLKKSGVCYSCDVNLRAGEGAPCFHCKNFSHKKCLDEGICKECLDKA